MEACFVSVVSVNGGEAPDSFFDGALFCTGGGVNSKQATCGLSVTAYDTEPNGIKRLKVNFKKHCEAIFIEGYKCTEA